MRFPNFPAFLKRRWCISARSRPLQMYWTRKAAEKRYDELWKFRDANVHLYHWASKPACAAGWELVKKKPLYDPEEYVEAWRATKSQG